MPSGTPAFCAASIDAVNSGKAFLVAAPNTSPRSVLPVASPVISDNGMPNISGATEAAANVLSYNACA